MKRRREIRRVNTASRLLACLVVAAVASPPGGAVAAQQLTAAERAAAVASVWAEARYNFAYWDRVRADWDSGLVANLKLAAEPQSDLLFYRRLRRLVALLGDGRATVIAPPSLRSRIARPPLLVSSVERRLFILDYAENDEMRVARPPRLGEILAVQGIPVETWIRDSVLPEVSAATLPDRWPLDPPAFATEWLPDGVAVVRIASLGDGEVVREVDRAFPDFARVQGLVLDLRHATEGKTEYAYQILARLTDRPFPAVRWRTPQYRAVFRAWNLGDSATTWYGPEPGTVAPREDHPSYGGPIAVLASSATAGAAEDLLAAFRAAGRGVIIGEPSAGSPGDVATFALPKSWSVQFSVARHEAPDGTGFAGVGVRPDLLVIRTVDDLLAGNEPALDRAREYLKGGKP